MSDGLPDGWATEVLPALGELARGKSKHRPRNDPRLFGGQFPFIQTGEVARSPGQISEAATFYSDFGLLQSRLWPRNTLCITIAANIASTAILEIEACFPDSVVGFIADEELCHTQFIEYYMRTIRGDLERFAPATAQKNINLDVLNAIEVPLPPLPEQHRIVDKIDSLFARSTRARDELAHIPRLIERYRQAVLEAAFRGDLTADWRIDHQPAAPSIARRSPIDGRAEELGDLPAEWVWQSIGDVCEVTGGLTKNQSRHALPIKMPYLRVANVYANELRLDEIEEIGVSAGEADRVRLMPGDLLIVEGNGSLDQIGRVALWQGEIGECGHQNHLIKARPTANVTAKFALYWLLSPAGRKAIEVVASSSAGLHTLSISKVKGLPIPCCSPDEMAAVVEQVEGQFDVLAGADGQFRRTQGMLARLDQSILDKAFSGQLVPQDATDEPAAALLERIQAERSGSPKAKRGRKKGTVSQ